VPATRRRSFRSTGFRMKNGWPRVRGARGRPSLGIEGEVLFQEIRGRPPPGGRAGRHPNPFAAPG
jgi:hypothetical protein